MSTPNEIRIETSGHAAMTIIEVEGVSLAVSIEGEIIEFGGREVLSVSLAFAEERKARAYEKRPTKRNYKRAYCALVGWKQPRKVLQEVLEAGLTLARNVSFGDKSPEYLTVMGACEQRTRIYTAMATRLKVAAFPKEGELFIKL